MLENIRISQIIKIMFGLRGPVQALTSHKGTVVLVVVMQLFVILFVAVPVQGQQWWSAPADLGGVTLASGPGAVAGGHNRIDVFYRGPNNHLWTSWWPDKEGSPWWSAPADLGGVELTSEPTAVTGGHNRIDVFYRGPNNHLWTSWWPDKPGSQWWSAPTDLGGEALTSAPAAVANAKAQIDVFYQGPNSKLWTSWWPDKGGSPIVTPGMPMDLVWGQLDDNGLPLNPEWQYQITNQDFPNVGGRTERSGVTSRGTLNGQALCDVYDPHLAGCTSQQVTSNTQPNTWINAGCNWPELAGLFTSGLFAGHKNWFPVTVTGPVVLDAGYDDSWAAANIIPGAIGWDADMDFYMVPPKGSLSGVRSGLTLSSLLDKDGQIGPEWDGYEVFFDQGGSGSWWNLFFKRRNTRADSFNTAKMMVNPDYPNPPKNRDDSVVIGLLGLDCRHYCHTELHPTYAMAIHTQADRTNDLWAVFARNWGNEGSCGSLQEEVAMQSFSMRLHHPYATGVRINSNDFVGRAGRYDQDITILSPPAVGWNLSSTVVNAGTPDAAAILTITLPPPEARAVVLGELALTWTELLTETRGPAAAVTQQPPQAATGSRDDEHIEGLIERMTPAQRKVFLANVPKPKPPTPKRAVLIPQNPHLGPVRVQDFKKLVRSAPDPAREQQMRQFNQAICMAYDGKLPGLPEACSTLGPTPVTRISLINAEPSPVQFTPVSTGSQAVTVTNISKAQVTLGTPLVTGADATDFAIDTGCRNSSLAPGATCKISVTFRARGVGQRTAELEIPFSGGARATTVELTGPGLIP